MGLWPAELRENEFPLTLATQLVTPGGGRGGGGEEGEGAAQCLLEALPQDALWGRQNSHLVLCPRGLPWLCDRRPPCPMGSWGCSPAFALIQGLLQPPAWVWTLCSPRRLSLLQAALWTRFWDDLTQLPLYKPPFLVHKEHSAHFAPAIWGWGEAADSLQRGTFSPGPWVPLSPVCGQRLCTSIFSTSSSPPPPGKAVPRLGVSPHLRL